ncbi:MAG: cyclic peptide export ABC transporter [Pseudomonadota bacterium]|nr:cyclic peptide export ABC transporter [Pseudomonadota bacterium]
MNLRRGKSAEQPRQRIGLMSEFGRFAPNRVFLAVLAGGLSGCLYALAIPLILVAINAPDAGLSYGGADVQRFLGFEVGQPKLAAFFALFCLLILITRAAAAIIIARVSMELSVSLRERLCLRIAQSPYPQLEALGQAKLTVAVTDDVRRIISGAEVMPQMLINGMMLVGIFGFLYYINTHVFVFVLQAVAFGVVTFHLPLIVASRYLRRARQLYDTLERGVRGLILGVKELQLDRHKRIGYFDQILAPCQRDLLRAEKRAMTTLLAANSYGDLLFFFVIGAIAFVFVNYHAISGTDLVAVVMVLLYITGPIAVILNALPNLSVATVSLRKIEEILGDLPEQAETERQLRKRPWRTISFAGASYRHRADHADDGFTVGPLDFAIRKGEITFIVGGNGSGKSTLCKILSLHYPTATGRILFDEQVVDADCIDDYRQDIATVFSDYHLFDRLLSPMDEEKLAEASRYLRELAIDHKVQIKDGVFSTTDLSDGQRKRLALVVSFVDDKELYLLDEWAADQDPTFKNVFYNEILLDLKAKGKAVVVVSHDDRYFHVADQLLIMEDGKIIEKRLKQGVSHKTGAVAAVAMPT